jgi:hypothetical protein
MLKILKMQLGFVYTHTYQKICFTVLRVYGSGICLVPGFQPIGTSFFQ